MGLCQSEEEKNLHDRSKGIDREIKESALENAKAIKLLLLGWFTFAVNMNKIVKFSSKMVHCFIHQIYSKSAYFFNKIY